VTASTRLRGCTRRGNPLPSLRRLAGLVSLVLAPLAHAEEPTDPSAPQAPAPGENPPLVRLVQQADSHVARGELPQAIRKYEEALREGAGSAAVLNRLGQLYLATGAAERAIPVFVRSLREQPGQLSVYSRLSEAFVAQGQLDSAIHYVAAARQLAPGASSICSSLGFLYLQRGAAGRARAYLDTALALEPANPEAHRFMGLYFTQLDSLDEAVAHFLRVTEILPSDMEAHNNIAFLYARQQRYAESLEYYRLAKSLATDPNILHAVNMNVAAVRAIMEGKMRARFILVGTEAEGRDILQRLQSGEDFGQLAARFSTAPNARDGGDLGFFGPGDMRWEVEEAVLQLKEGEVSDIILIEPGVMILQRLK